MRGRARAAAVCGAVAGVVVALGVTIVPGASAATTSGAVISNGTVMLGVNSTGDLNYNCSSAGDTGCPPTSVGGATAVGLRYVPNNTDGTAPGCLCEGWGVADATSGLAGGATQDNPNSGGGTLTVNSFTATATTAVSDVTLANPSLSGYQMRVVQDYHPTLATPNLYEDLVTITNTGSNPLGDVRYRRAMDWDAEPTPFHEWVTIQGTTPELRFDSDDGFADVNPLAGPSYIDSSTVCGSGYTGACSFTDLGAGGTYPTVTSPDDHGALFDFGFGALAPGASRTFHIFYGAAANETSATTALSSVGAGVYSLGEPNCPETAASDSPTDSTGCNSLPAHSGVEHGQPNTFIFGFFTSTASSDLSITKSDGTDPVAPGGSETYHVTVTNNGPDAASGVTVSDPLPAGSTYVSSTPSQGSCSQSAGTVTCALGSLANGASASVDIAMTAPTSGTSMSNTATVSSTSADPVGSNNSATATTTISSGSVNQPPTVSAGGPYTGTEGSATSINGTATDPESDPLTTSWSATPGAGTDPGAACTFGNAAALSTTVTCNDDGTFTLTLSANDGHNPAVTSTATLTVANANPSVTITSPADMSTVSVNTPTSVQATVTDPGSNDTQTCTIDWGDGTTGPGTLSAGVCSGTHTYTAVGVYTVTVTATDDDGGTGQASITLVVTSAATNVTGGGFLVDNGRTSFGFEAGPAATGFQGQLEVHPPGKDRFHADTVNTMSVSGSTATWTGSGRWDRTDGYTFQVSVVDNGSGGGRTRTPDTISLTIYDPAHTVVFSSSGPLKGGNITVHRATA